MKTAFSALFAAILSAVTPAPLSADERDDAIDAAVLVMDHLGNKKFGDLWDNLTSDWFKSSTGANKQSFIANMTIARQPIGSLMQSDILDVKYMTSIPGANYTGKIYIVTFSNSYSTGKSFEQIVVVDENGVFKMSGFFGAPQP